MPGATRHDLPRSAAHKRALAARAPRSRRCVLCVCLSLLCAGAFALYSYVTNFALLREAYVRRVSPLLLTGDASEGRIYTEVLPKHGFPLPLEKGGCVWDVGAHDGIWNSNSHYLIHSRGFAAWLFEPDAWAFVKLRELYGASIPGGGKDGKDALAFPQVHLHNFAVSPQGGLKTFRAYPVGLGNTISRTRVHEFDDVQFQYHVWAMGATTLCEQQTTAYRNRKCAVGDASAAPQGVEVPQFSVMSIDAEGTDMSLFRALNSTKCRYDVLIIESPSDVAGIEAGGYHLVAIEGFNRIFVRRGYPHGAAALGG